QHVGARAQALEPRAVRLLRELEAHAALVRGAVREEEAPRAGEGREPARDRALRRLDADDVGAEVGEQAPGELSLLVGEIEDADSSEGAVGHGFLWVGGRIARYAKRAITWSAKRAMPERLVSRRPGSPP